MRWLNELSQGKVAIESRQKVRRESYGKKAQALKLKAYHELHLITDRYNKLQSPLKYTNKDKEKVLRQSTFSKEWKSFLPLLRCLTEMT